MEVTASQLAEIVQGTVEGDCNVKVSDFAKIEMAKPGTLTFLANPKYEHFIYTTEASIVLVSKDFKPQHPVKATLVRVADPYTTLAHLVNYVSSLKPRKKGIEAQVQIDSTVTVPESSYVGSFTYIAKGAVIGENVQIYPQCYIGEGVVIGDNTTLYPGVKIYYGCKVGKDCILHAGTVIGGDGFGFAPDGNGSYTKISQIGNVVIEDDVEIGSNVTIDRAMMGSTIIHKGVKLDNLIQVAHNVEIGEHTVMAAQVGVAGSTKIGRGCMVGGQVGFAGHISVADRTNIGAQSGIPNNITSEGGAYMGYPAVPARDFARQAVYIKNLSAMSKEIKELKKQLSELKNR